MADFMKAMEGVLRLEGLYSNDPNDAGGETVCGIARARHPEWPGWPVLDRLKARAGARQDEFTKALAWEVDHGELRPHMLAFYRAEFWDKVNGDALPETLGRELFEQAVNQGAGTAVRLLQEALNLLNRGGESWSDIPVDGGFGPRTLDVLRRALARPGEEAMLVKLVNLLQAEKYLDICRANPKQEKFLRGWLARA